MTCRGRRGLVVTGVTTITMRWTHPAVKHKKPSQCISKSDAVSARRGWIPPRSAGHLPVDLQGLLGDVRPGEFLDAPLPAGLLRTPGPLRVGDECVDRFGQSGLEELRVVRRRSAPTARSGGRPPPRGCRRRRRPPPPSRTPSPRGSRYPTARTPTGIRKLLLLRVFRGSSRSAASRAPRTRRCGRADSSCTASVTSAAISGVSGAPAHSTSCTSGANWCAAATRCATPFCRVIRPTNATIGRVGSTPSSASTDSPAAAPPDTRHRCRCRCAPRAPGWGPAPG